MFAIHKELSKSITTYYQPLSVIKMFEKILLKQEDLELKEFKRPLSPKQTQVLPLEENTTLRSEMKALKKGFIGRVPVVISTPFKGTSLAITKDGSKYVFSSYEGRVAICDVKTKRILLDKDVKERNIWNLAIYNEDSILLSAGSGKLIRKLQISNLAELDVFYGHEDEVNYVLVSNDEQWAYSCSDDSSVRKWNLNEKNPSGKILYKQVGRVYGMGLSTDCRLLGSVGDDGKVYIYDLNEFSDGIVKVLQETSDTL